MRLILTLSFLLFTACGIHHGMLRGDVIDSVIYDLTFRAMVDLDCSEQRLMFHVIDDDHVLASCHNDVISYTRDDAAEWHRSP